MTRLQKINSESLCFSSHPSITPVRAAAVPGGFGDVPGGRAQVSCSCRASPGPAGGKLQAGERGINGVQLKTPLGVGE